MARKIVKQTKKELEKIEKQKQLKKEYRKHYARVKKYVERFKDIGWVIPKELIPPEPETVTKRQVTKFSKIKIKEFRSKLKTLVDTETGEVFKGKKAKELGQQREKEWREHHKKKTEETTHDMPQPTAPYFGFIMELRTRLENLPSGKWVKSSSGGKMFYTFTEKANVLISVIDDNLMYDDYLLYLNNNKENITLELDKWEMYDSEQEGLEYTFIGLYNLLDYHRLYDINDVAEELSLMTDFYNLG